MRPLTPKLSPPAFPTNTSPLQAIGASGADSPLFGSPMATSQSCRPSAALMATTCASPVPRNTRPSLVGDAAVHHQKRIGLGDVCASTSAGRWRHPSRRCG